MATIVISGVSSGIGRALVSEFLQRGEHVVVGISGRSQLLFSAGEPSERYRHIELSHSETGNYQPLLDLLLREGLQPDALVNNAGMMLNKPWNQISLDEGEDLFRVNVLKPFLLIKALVPMMSRPSHIVNITSMGGIMGSVKFPGLSLYSASKGALSVLTEALAEELKDTGVRVNGIAPGAVQTEMLQTAFPGYQAPVTPGEMARFLADFTLTGHNLFNGKVLPAAVSTP